MTETITKSTIVDERCQATIDACLNRISQVTSHYGPVIGNEMASSFAYAFGRLHAFGGTIYPDGPLGFVCVSYIMVGMVFFQDRPEQTLARIKACHGDFVDEISEGWPLAGEWSLHS